MQSVTGQLLLLMSGNFFSLHAWPPRGPGATSFRNVQCRYTLSTSAALETGLSAAVLLVQAIK